MQTATDNLASLDGRAIPYRWATPGQQAQAVLWMARQLHDHFPTLSVAELEQTFHQFKPELWEDPNGICLDYADLVRLTQQLAHSPRVPNLYPPIYCADACYLAEVYTYLSQVAIGLLPELEANPLAHDAKLMALIVRLATGNSVAERVLRETRSRPVANDH